MSSVTEPIVNHLIEARTAASMSFDDVERLVKYLRWSGMTKLSEEAQDICNWLARIENQVQTEISKEVRE